MFLWIFLNTLLELYDTLEYHKFKVSLYVKNSKQLSLTLQQYVKLQVSKTPFIFRLSTFEPQPDLLYLVSVYLTKISFPKL